MDNIIVRDESKLHTVPTKVISTMPIFIFVMFISIIISIVLFCKKNISAGCIWFGVAFACWLWGKFVDIFFEFKKNYKIEFQKSQFKVTYDLDSQIYSSKDHKVTVTIKEIEKFHKRRNKVVIFGSITTKKPKQGTKEIKKYVLDLKGFDDCDTIIKKLSDYSVTN